MLKKKKEVLPGWGSKNPKYTEHRQWQMASATDEEKQEEHYPRLNENPNAIYPDNADYIIEYHQSPAFPFSCYDGKMFVGNIGDTHDNLLYDAPHNYYGDGRGQ